MELAMSRLDVLDDLLGDRRSVRGFHSDPVPEDVLARVFTMAQQSPSNCNVQPWVVHVASGAAIDRVRTALHAHAASDAEVSADYPVTVFPGVYRERQIDAAKALFAATGVTREDAAARRTSFLRNYLFFDAPHVAFVFVPDWAGMREAADCGMYAQSLMLALTAHGLASCPQGALSWHPGVVRRALGVDDSMRLLFGLSFGYEDVDHPANTTRTDRASIDQAIIFHD